MSSPGHRLPELVAIMDRLLAPDGCPWDREQTLASLRPFLVEETYEVLDAMDRVAYGGPWRPFAEELGDLLFQIVSNRYERGAMIVTSNTASKQWPSIFNNDATLTSALLDRLLHHAETVVITGKSYRMKDQTDT